MEDHLALDAQIPDDPRRQILRDLVRAVHAPELRHDEVSVDVMEASGADGAEVMDPDHALPRRPLERLDEPVQQRRVLLVQEPSRRVAHEPEPRPHERERHEPGHDGIDPCQAREAEQQEPDDDSGAGPEIGEHVLAVGDEGEGLVPPPGPHQKPSEREVGESRAEHDEEAGAEIPDLHAVEQTAHGFVEDDDGGERDEPALEGGGEELDLAVTVRVVAVGGSPREHDAANGEHRGHDVDDRLERIGQDRGGAGHPVRLVLRGEQQDGYHERDQTRPETNAFPHAVFPDKPQPVTATGALPEVRQTAIAAISTPIAISR